LKFEVNYQDKTVLSILLLTVVFSLLLDVNYTIDIFVLYSF